eukprot:15349803-Ditylum_brightwellii.AAC.1
MVSKNKGRKASTFKMLAVACTLWGTASGEATTNETEDCKFCEMFGCSAVVATDSLMMHLMATEQAEADDGYIGKCPRLIKSPGHFMNPTATLHM